MIFQICCKLTTGLNCFLKFHSKLNGIAKTSSGINDAGFLLTESERNIEASHWYTQYTEQ